MLEVLEVLMAIAEVAEAPALSTDAAIWMDDLFFFFFWQQHKKHLEKPSLKDLKNKATDDQRNYYVVDLLVQFSLFSCRFQQNLGLALPIWEIWDLPWKGLCFIQEIKFQIWITFKKSVNKNWQKCTLQLHVSFQGNKFTIYREVRHAWFEHC